MSLSSELISEFARITNDKPDTKNKETVVYGTVVEDTGVFYVKLDGSDYLTPMSTTTNVKDGDRITVMIKNHTAVATGNITSPSATVVDIGDVTDAADKLVGFEVRVSELESTSEATEERVTLSETSYKQLIDSISTMVTDANGNSMMTQTSNGWTFNMSSIEDTLNQATNNLNEMSGEMDNIGDTIEKLKSLANDLATKTAYIIMTTDDEGNPCIELGKEDNPFKVRITNTSVDFMDGSSKIAYVNNNALNIERAVIKDELQIGEGSGFVWKKRSNGNLSLRLVGD